MQKARMQLPTQGQRAVYVNVRFGQSLTRKVICLFSLWPRH